MAFGKHDPDNKPDKAIIKTLLELLPKVVGPETDNSESPIAQIVRELIANRTAD
jgi:flagellar biosynthesis/type III secretory pathway protein FliH